mgnify:CR=1 FL=1
MSPFYEACPESIPTKMGRYKKLGASFKRQPGYIFQGEPAAEKPEACSMRQEKTSFSEYGQAEPHLIKKKPGRNSGHKKTPRRKTERFDSYNKAFAENGFSAAFPHRNRKEWAIVSDTREVFLRSRRASEKRPNRCFRPAILKCAGNGEHHQVGGECFPKPTEIGRLRFIFRPEEIPA